MKGQESRETTMGSVWWTVGYICGGLILLAGVVLLFLVIMDLSKRRRIVKQGDQVNGWLVQANIKLFESGWVDLPALALISPTKETGNDEEFLADLAERIMQLKGVDPADCQDKDEAFVAELMSDETYIEGKRDKLPEGFTDGRDVYLAHVYVYREHLPQKRLEDPRCACAIIWDEPHSLICTRPKPASGEGS